MRSSPPLLSSRSEQSGSFSNDKRDVDLVTIEADLLACCISFKDGALAISPRADVGFPLDSTQAQSVTVATKKLWKLPLWVAIEGGCAFPLASDV